MKSTVLFKFISILFVSLLVSSCNKEDNQSSGGSGNNSNGNNSANSGTAVLKLYIGGVWKSYDLSSETNLDRGDCLGSWEEYLGFGLWDGINFWLGSGTAEVGTFNYLEDSFDTMCETPEIEIHAFGDMGNDLEENYDLPIYDLIDTNGDGQFSITSLANNKVSITWSGNVKIRRSTYYDVLDVIPATFTATNEPYEDLRYN
jgi:hypothetical protein